MAKNIVGAAFPVHYRLMSRFFEEGKTVFVKNSKFSRLHPGAKILFYASQGVHAFVGEGTIETVEFLTPQKTLQKYKKDLFLTETELNVYAREKTISKQKETELNTFARKKPVSEFLVVRFAEIKKYPTPVKPKRFISVGGKYISKPEYEVILSTASR